MFIAGNLQAPSPAKRRVPSNENLSANIWALAVKYFIYRLEEGE